jgi:hypothetical protein
VDQVLDVQAGSPKPHRPVPDQLSVTTVKLFQPISIGRLLDPGQEGGYLKLRGNAGPPFSG